METTTVPVSEEQPEKEESRQPQQPADGEACAAVETVASTDCTDSRKVESAEETEKLYAERKENAIPEGSSRSGTEEAKTNRDSSDGAEPEEQIVELDSSPEKSTGRTKEDALKSPPDLETYSVDDEEEHEGELVVRLLLLMRRLFDLDRTTRCVVAVATYCLLLLHRITTTITFTVAVVVVLCVIFLISTVLPTELCLDLVQQLVVRVQVVHNVLALDHLALVAAVSQRAYDRVRFAEAARPVRMVVARDDRKRGTLQLN